MPSGVYADVAVELHLVQVPQASARLTVELSLLGPWALVAPVVEWSVRRSARRALRRLERQLDAVRPSRISA